MCLSGAFRNPFYGVYQGKYIRDQGIVESDSLPKLARKEAEFRASVYLNPSIRKPCVPWIIRNKIKEWVQGLVYSLWEFRGTHRVLKLLAWSRF